MTKHTPDTPLPWRVVWTKKRAWLVGAQTQHIAGTADSGCGKQFEFAAHAANAYPRSVAAHKSAEFVLAKYGDQSIPAVATALHEIRALLHELGELA